MDRKTSGMILFLKHRGSEYPSYREAAIAFMMQYSGCGHDAYPKEIIEDIIFEVFRDFIGSCDNPSFELWQVRECKKIADLAGDHDKNVYDYMLTTLVLCSVRGDTGYVNGFKDSDFDGCSYRRSNQT